jgi:hypothetical protein
LKNSAHLSFVYKNFDVYGSYLYKRWKLSNNY